MINPDFGFEPNEDGQIEFMTVHSDFEIHNFEEYMLFFKQLVELATLNAGIMPIYRPNEPER